MRCKWLTEKIQDAKIAKNSPSAHHHTTLLGYIFAAKACIDNRKKMLNINIFLTCPHNMVNFGPLAAEIGWQVWSTPTNFNRFRVLASLLHRRRSTEVNQNFARCLAVSWAGILYKLIHVRGLLPPNGILTGAKLACDKILCSPILAALLHGTRAVGSARLCSVQQRAPYIFGRAAITLGIGPHSS